jgi:hypothetical protein
MLGYPGNSANRHQPQQWVAEDATKGHVRVDDEIRVGVYAFFEYYQG